MFSIPKIFTMTMVKVIEYLDDSPKIDSEGKTIYQDGRKTIESFGDRKQFEILRSIRVDGTGNIIHNDVRWSLFDRDKNKDIDMNIENYEYLRPYIVEKDEKGRYKHIYLPEDKLKPYVYTKGSKGYTRLNYKSGEVKQSQNINDFAEEEQEIFKNLDAGKGRTKPKNK